MPTRDLTPEEDAIIFAVRVASAAVAVYDYLETFPTAYKFYRQQWSERRFSFSLSFILFALIRLTSILIVSISSYGFFASFTPSQCERYFILAPAFKVIQGMVSQAILGVRAYTVSGRNKYVGVSLLVIDVVVVVLQWIVTLGGREAQVYRGSVHACRPVSMDEYAKVTLYQPWIFYVLAIAFDFAATVVTVFYLHRQLKVTTGFLSKVVRILLRDGIGYFVVLCLINIANAIFYKLGAQLQNGLASLGHTLTWIMSQRLIIHLYRASEKKRTDQIMTSTGNGLLTVTQPLTTGRSVNYAVRSQFSKKQDSAFTDLSVPEFSMDLERSMRSPSPIYEERDEQHAVEVRVEKTVRVSRSKVRYQMEDYSRGGSSSHRGQ